MNICPAFQVLKILFNEKTIKRETSISEHVRHCLNTKRIYRRKKELFTLGKMFCPLVQWMPGSVHCPVFPCSEVSKEAVYKSWLNPNYTIAVHNF